MIHCYAFLYNYSGMNRTRQFVADTLFTHARKTPVLRGEGFFFSPPGRDSFFFAARVVFSSLFLPMEMKRNSTERLGVGPLKLNTPSFLSNPKHERGIRHGVSVW
jgi:hypothetical protein